MPTLDLEPVELARRFPDWARVRGLSRKRALKLAVAHLLQVEMVRRPKDGFGLPLDRWVRTDLRPLMQGMLGSRWRGCTATSTARQ